MADFFLNIYRIIAKIKWWMLLLLLGIFAILINVVRQIAFDDDISALIPVNEETKRIQKVLKSIAFTDKIVVNIRKDKAGSVGDLTAYANEFLDSLESNQGAFIKNIQGKIDDEALPKTMDFVYNNLPLFLNPSDYAYIEQKLSKDSIAKITRNNYRTLLSPTGIIAKKNIVKDPLGISFIALKKLRQLGFGEGFKVKNGFLLNQSESNILLFITPKFASGETNKNLPFSEALYAIQDQLNTKYQSKVISEYFGAALSAVSNALQIQRDIKFTVSIAMTLLLILLIAFYRKLALPFILFAPTLFGGLLAIAFLVLFREKISAISLGIGAVLLGVTLDYALHILTHLRNGKSVQSLYKEVAPSVLMSSLTTASAFLCLLFLSSQALQDLGIFAGVSVLGASVFALIFIPQVYKTKEVLPKKTTVLDRLASYNLHKNKWAIGGISALFIISMFTYGHVVFDQDITKLNYETQALLDARERLEKLTDIGAKSMYLSTYGSNLEEVLQQNDKLHSRLERLKTEGDILSFSSLGALVKSKKDQQKKIADWKQFWKHDRIQILKNNLIETGLSYGFKPNTYDLFYKRLETDNRPLALNDMRDLPLLSLDDYLIKDEIGFTMTSLIKLDENKIPLVQNQFEDESNTLLIDRRQVNESFLGGLKNDFDRLLGYSMVVVLLILLLFYRSFTLTLITGFPIFLSWFLTVGIMGLFHIEFNIFNIIICSFIFGLGVDYSIFMTNGLLYEYRWGERILPTHKTSIILSVITTMAGVGVLIFAKHPVLYSVSVVALIGILSAMFVAFMIQPLLFRLFIGGPDKRPIKPRVVVHSLLSFAYFDLIGLLLSLYSWIVLKVDPLAHLKEQMGLHLATSKFMKSVLYTNPFLTKKVINPQQETFEKPAMIIANHTSFLDILAMGMLHPKLIYLVKDHVYNSPIVGSAAKLHGAYPVSGGVENGEAFLKQKVAQGFSIVAFPEGSRSSNNKIHRFHKGAFYLAENLGLDLLPIMIHGGSEVSPKDSFIIRDGSFTVKLLPRIKADDATYGTSYSQRPKLFGQYFRKAFRNWRNEIEDDRYWHTLLLENYRYKGDTIYRGVKKDLREHKAMYKKLLSAIGEKDSMLHMSASYGQLDLLLALDSIDRKIYTYLENRHARAILKNNYLTLNYSKIKVCESIDGLFKERANICIIDTNSIDLGHWPKGKLDEISILILLKGSKKRLLKHALDLGFELKETDKNFTLLHRIKA